MRDTVDTHLYVSQVYEVLFDPRTHQHASVNEI